MISVDCHGYLTTFEGFYFPFDEALFHGIYFSLLKAFNVFCDHKTVQIVAFVTWKHLSAFITQQRPIDTFFLLSYRFMAIILRPELILNSFYNIPQTKVLHWYFDSIDLAMILLLGFIWFKSLAQSIKWFGSCNTWVQRHQWFIHWKLSVLEKAKLRWFHWLYDAVR